MSEEIQDLAAAMPFQGVIPVDVRRGEDPAAVMQSAQQQYAYMFYKRVLQTAGTAEVGAASPCRLPSPRNLDCIQSCLIYFTFFHVIANGSN